MHLALTRPSVRSRLRHAGAALLATAALWATPAAAAVPSPQVTGPVPVNAPPGSPSRDHPWLATMHQLDAVGYVEEEFFIEGTANRYDTSGPTGTNATVVQSGLPYRTRILVRRPASPHKFNGTVLAEWQNVTAGYDLDAMWGASFEHILRAGYAWVGISAQRVGVQGTPNGLVNWSPTRYGTLDVTAGGQVVDDALSYDIFAQAMQALRQPTGVRPMGRLAVRQVLAIGASQSAGRMQVFINKLHPLIGEPVDGYLLYIGGGAVRTDLPVPIFKLLSETDVPVQVPARQPDTPLFRLWEVAGTSHSGRRTVLNSRPLLERDGVAPSVGECALPPYPRVPVQHVTNAAFDHLARWARDGVAPPSAPLLETDGAVIRRDANGNALGGIRLAEFAVPTALNSGANTGSAFCRLYGTYQPFGAAQLDALYPTHGAYVAPVMAQLHATVRAGYVLPQDARRTAALAAVGIVGTNAVCEAACRAAQDLLEATFFYAHTSGRDDLLAAHVNTAIHLIARAAASGRSGAPWARPVLRHFIDDVRQLERRGRLSAVSAGELVEGAEGVLALLP